MRRTGDKLTELARSVVEPMGYELVGVDYLPSGHGGSVLRVYIDHEKGITLDVSRVLAEQVDLVKPFDVQPVDN